MELVQLSDSLYQSAANLAYAHRLKALDAIHLAAALRANEDAETPLVLVTIDKELVVAGRNSGFPVLNPKEIDAPEMLSRLRS